MGTPLRRLPSGNAASSVAMSSVSSTSSAAAAFSRTCSTLDAFGMANSPGFRVAIGDLLQGLAARAAGRERRAPERRVPDDGDAVRRAVGQNRVLDRPLAQVIQDLIARDPIRPRDGEREPELVLVEVAEAP